MTVRVVSARAASSAIICLGLLGCTGAKQEGFAKQGEERATPAEDKAAPAKSSKSEPAAATKPSEPAAGPHPGLTDPSKATEKAPDTFHVKFTTTKGDFVVEVSRAWAPNGADRLYNLVKIGYFKDLAFFRAIQGFMVQFGIHGDPAVSAAWRRANIQDDPVKESNAKGYVTFATAGPNTRTTQLFINYADNRNLDSMGFSPVGKVVQGMEVVESLHKGYGEGAPRGRGPDQGRVQGEGNAYLKRDFPNLDYIQSATIVE
jgi:peptidyl-prolyl cis-trans isomerase A (cyclophilin A)